MGARSPTCESRACSAPPCPETACANPACSELAELVELPNPPIRVHAQKSLNGKYGAFTISTSYLLLVRYHYEGGVRCDVRHPPQSLQQWRCVSIGRGRLASAGGKPLPIQDRPIAARRICG